MAYSGTLLPSQVQRLSSGRQQQWIGLHEAAVQQGLDEISAQSAADDSVRRGMGLLLSSGHQDVELLADIAVLSGQQSYYEGTKLSQEEAAYDPFGAADGKGCATCRWFLYGDYCRIVDGSIYPGGISNRYEAIPEPTILAVPVQLVDSLGDVVSFGDLFASLTAGGMSLEAGWHEQWTAKYVDSLPDSSFAFIDPGGKRDSEGKTKPRSLRHFPYKDANGKLDEAHVRNAVSRVPQSHVSAVGKHAALVKLHGAARTLGVKLSADPMPTATASSQEPKPKSFPRNAYESIVGFLGIGGHESETGLELPPGVVAFPEGPLFSLSEGDGGLFTPLGRLRYWAIASNNFYDNKGKEFPEAAQHDYVDWVWQDPERRMAELQIWHTPGTRLGQDDWVDFDGHFLHSTGLIDVGREELARKYASDPEIAMSHGYVVVWDEHERAVSFRSYEKSVLPRQYAGNSFTSFGLEEDNVAFSEPRKNFLREGGLSDDEITARERRWEEFGSTLEKMGIGFHELEVYVDSARAENVAPASPPPAAVPATPAVATSDGEAPAVTPLATDSMTLESLRAMLESVVDQKIAPLQQELHAVQVAQQSVDKGVADAMRGRERPTGFNPSTSPTTVPAIAQTQDGQPTLVSGQHAADGIPLAPLDHKVLSVIAAGVQSGETAGETAISWMESRLKANHPIFNGQPTEVRR